MAYTLAMDAIITKFLPATATKGARIKATLPAYNHGERARSVTVSYYYGYSNQDNHRSAAWEAAFKFWGFNINDPVRMHMGSLSTGYACIFTPDN